MVIRLGEKLNNPYSVENMKKAFDSLQNEGILRSAYNIEATHLYVRFLPANCEELESLYKDTTLTLFSYPLDYELSEGEIYIDSTLFGKTFAWFYTRVPVGYISPIDCMETLEELYLPMIEESTQSVCKLRTASISNEDWILLERKSMGITGNLTDVDNTMLRSKWIPKVTVKVYDDVKCKNIPLEGVKVRARKWFNWESSITDENGYAVMPDDYSGKVNYSIIWERDNWDIRSGSIGQAYYNGPYSDSNWNLVIEEKYTSKSYLYAHIHHACFTYWFKNGAYGIKIPFHDSFWTTKVKILAYDEAGRSYTDVDGKKIHFYRSQSAVVNRSCSHIFESAIHELSHISHGVLINNNFKDVAAKVYEGWSTGVAYTISKDYYPLNSLFYGDWQDVTLDEIVDDHSNTYTPIVIDLLDDLNQRAEHDYNPTDYPIDRVKGYTLSQIECSLKGANTLAQWRDKLKSLYENETEQYLDELFEQYINL